MSRGTYDCADKDNNGLAIRINLYIIKSMYYGMKKANVFMVNNAGRKPKSVPIYGNSLPISRQRFDRINGGMCFEFTSKEANKIVDTFGIEMKYFRRDDPDMFGFFGIESIDWQCYYYEYYKASYQVNVKDVKTRAEKVKKKLKELAHKDWKQSPDKKNPLYRIWYYFHTGERYEEESRADKCINALRNMKYKDWLESPEKLEEASQLLKKHYDYVAAFMTIERLGKEN